MAVVSSFRSAMASAIAAFLLFALPSAIAVTVFTTLSLPPVTGGPKSVAFDLRGGGPYTGISDGRIVKYTPPLGFIGFAFTAGIQNKTFCDGRNATANATVGLICGRPLGIAFNSTEFLYICDAYLGLYVVSPLGGQRPRSLLLPKAHRSASVMAWTSILIPAWSTSQMLVPIICSAALNRNSTGRLRRFDPRTGQVTMLARGLSGPGGIAVASDSSFVLVTEFIGGTVKKFFLTGLSANTFRTLLNVPSPSTIRRTTGGEFTVTERVRAFTHRALRIDANGTVMANVSVGGPYNDVTVVTGVQIYGLNTTQAILGGDIIRRLLRFNLRIGQVTVLAMGLLGPGGVAMANDSSYLLITEFVSGTVKKFFLTGPRANTTQTLLNNVPIASSIKRTPQGEFTLTETV
ncbi:protein STRICTOSIDINE SYNTHASE-LIKE 12-like [Eucalyptus grandis]|uniref:protein STRICTOSIDINE SYNTHASE-LIKE 12-like n=1 Tax=Eucalyptus grandis TaxID=71139 RepID=UPI00192EF8C1|nr:protein STRICTOSIDINE SYNTHASE-LIKE 12-like [Eucalyptus grandis]